MLLLKVFKCWLESYYLFKRKGSEKCPWSEGLHDHVQIDLESVENIVEGSKKIVEKLNGDPLHALVNNAGISPKEIRIKD